MIRTEHDTHTELASRFGTPFYVHETELLEAAARDLVAALPDRAELFFSLKANPNPAVGAVLRRAGCRAEVSSKGELAAAIAAGFVVRDILYTGPGKTAAEIDEAIRYGVRTFSVESFADLRKVNEIASDNRAAVSSILRINAPAAQGSSGMRMTGTASQFGIDISGELPTADDLVAAGGNVVGFHFYPVSNSANESVLVEEMTASIEHAHELAGRWGIDVGLLDLGGGFAAPYGKPGQRPLYRGLRSAVESALDRRFPQWRTGQVTVAFESGRYLTCDAGSLIARVVDVKKSAEIRYVVTDTGIHHVGGLSGIGRTPPLAVSLAVGAERPAMPEDDVTVVGPLCTPADVLNYRLSDARAVEPGDLVTIPNVGAYGVTASLMGFLSRPAPVEIVTENGAVVSATAFTLSREDMTS